MAAAGKKKGSVGVIGLGIMGGAFAKNLAAAGWHVVGFDPNPARRREAQRAGVELAKDAAEVARAAPVVLTSLPNPKALMTTVHTIAAAKLPKRLIAEMSTFRVVRSSNVEFTEAVRVAVQGTRFTPAKLNGNNVRQVVQQPFAFALRAGN